jgi:hypothetical protein
MLNFRNYRIRSYPSIPFYKTEFTITDLRAVTKKQIYILFAIVGFLFLSLFPTLANDFDEAINWDFYN